MRKKPTRKRPYFKLESAMTAILCDASGKMHHGILFDPPLQADVLSGSSLVPAPLTSTEMSGKKRKLTPLVTSVRQHQNPCSGPLTDSTNYQKCISNILST